MFTWQALSEMWVCDFVCLLSAVQESLCSILLVQKPWLWERVIRSNYIDTGMSTQRTVHIRPTCTTYQLNTSTCLMMISKLYCSFDSVTCLYFQYLYNVYRYQYDMIWCPINTILTAKLPLTKHFTEFVHQYQLI